MITFLLELRGEDHVSMIRKINVVSALTATSPPGSGLAPRRAPTYTSEPIKSRPNWRYTPNLKRPQCPLSCPDLVLHLDRILLAQPGAKKCRKAAKSWSWSVQWDTWGSLRSAEKGIGQFWSDLSDPADQQKKRESITYYELAPPALIYLYTCVELCRTSCTHIQVGQEQKAVWHLVSTTRWGSWDDRRMRYYWQIYIEAKTCSAKKLNKNKAMQNFWTTAPVPGGLLGRNFFQCGAKKE